MDFDASGLLGGIIHNGKKPGVDPVWSCIGHFCIKGAKGHHPTYHRQTIKVQCFPLYSVIKALGNPTIHYLR